MNESAEQAAEYIEQREIIRWDGARLPNLALEITKEATSRAGEAKALFDWVRDEIKYNPYSPFYLPEHYYPESTLDRGYGYCVQKSALLVGLARTLGIPARLVFADMVNHRFSEKLLEHMGSDLFTYHAYVDLYIGGKWVQATPSFEKALCEKLDIFPVEFDGVNSAILHKYDRQGNLHIEYVANHGTRADVPLDELLAAWNRVYGKERVDGWKKMFEDGLSRDALA